MEDIIFKNKDDFYLFGNIFSNKNIGDFTNNNCNKIEIETNFRYGDDDSSCILDLNNKKKNEEKKSILSHFNKNKCKEYSISVNNIIFLFDNPFINEYKTECKNESDYLVLKEIIIDSLINKYCVILRNNLILNNNKFYFLDEVSYNDREIISFTKIISFNKEKDELDLFCDVDLDEEIKKNKKIMIINEPRIEKVLKKNRKNNFNEILAKADFSYDITKEEKTKMITNGLDYLGKNDDNFL